MDKATRTALFGASFASALAIVSAVVPLAFPAADAAAWRRVLAVSSAIAALALLFLAVDHVLLPLWRRLTGRSKKPASESPMSLETGGKGGDGVFGIRGGDGGGGLIGGGGGQGGTVVELPGGGRIIYGGGGGGGGFGPGAEGGAGGASFWGEGGKGGAFTPSAPQLSRPLTYSMPTLLTAQTGQGFEIRGFSLALRNMGADMLRYEGVMARILVDDFPAMIVDGEPPVFIGVDQTADLELVIPAAYVLPKAARQIIAEFAADYDTVPSTGKRHTARVFRFDIAWNNDLATLKGYVDGADES